MLNRSASLAMSTSVLKALPGKLDIKRHSPSILYISASLAMSTSVLKALPGKLDIKRHSPSILYISASLAMSKSLFKALPGKLDIKRHSRSILYFLNILAIFWCQYGHMSFRFKLDNHVKIQAAARSFFKIVFLCKNYIIVRFIYIALFKGGKFLDNKCGTIV